PISIQTVPSAMACGSPTSKPSWGLERHAAIDASCPTPSAATTSRPRHAHAVVGSLHRLLDDPQLVLGDNDADYFDRGRVRRRELQFVFARGDGALEN